MDQVNRENVRKQRIAKLKSEMDELVKTGVTPEAAAGLLVASYVGEVALDIHMLNNRLTDLELQLKALVAKK